MHTCGLINATCGDTLHSKRDQCELAVQTYSRGRTLRPTTRCVIAQRLRYAHIVPYDLCVRRVVCARHKQQRQIRFINQIKLGKRRGSDAPLHVPEVFMTVQDAVDL